RHRQRIAGGARNGGGLAPQVSKRLPRTTRTPSAALVVFRRGVFPTRQLLCPPVQSRVPLERSPVDTPGFNGDIAHCFLPVSFGKRERRRLHRTLNQQALAIATLGGPGNLFPLPKNVKLLPANEALTGQLLAAAR